MSRPGFLEGTVVALLLAVTGAIALATLPLLLGGPFAARLVVTLLGGAYLVYLLRRSRARTGRLVVPCLWLAASALAWPFVGFGALVLLQVALIWLIRALYFHDRLLTALADLGLSGLALGAAVWALGAGSWLLALWAFFLVQALFTWLPGTASEPAAEPAVATDNGFDEARDLARAALERLATGR